jgi:hypothetical protein
MRDPAEMTADEPREAYHAADLDPDVKVETEGNRR